MSCSEQKEDGESISGSSETSVGETDRYGFLLCNGETQSHSSDDPCPQLVRHREMKWLSLINQWDQAVEKKHSKVKGQCQKGIPASVRAKCWPLLCGATHRKTKNEELFKRLDNAPGEPSWIDLIKRDTDRQFPFHEMFLSKDGLGQQGLLRVLKAYTEFRPEEGYCQAQGPVAAVLLMNMPVEEAFWCLVQISELYLPGYYSPLLEGVLFDAAILSGVIKRMCPAAYKHMQNQGVEPLMFATDWLMCLYSRHLPFNTLLRVWDLFFCYGARVLFQVAVVLVRRCLGEARQRKECEGQMETLERLRAVKGRVQHEHADNFIQEVCSVPLSLSELQRLTEKELEKWRKERPGSTFDPRDRCHGYHMLWQKGREKEKENEKKERQKCNLSVPLTHSHLSHSPAFLRKKWRRRGSKVEMEEWDAGGRRSPQSVKEESDEGEKSRMSVSSTAEEMRSKEDRTTTEIELQSQKDHDTIGAAQRVSAVETGSSSELSGHSETVFEEEENVKCATATSLENITPTDCNRHESESPSAAANDLQTENFHQETYSEPAVSQIHSKEEHQNEEKVIRINKHEQEKESQVHQAEQIDEVQQVEELNAQILQEEETNSMCNKHEWETQSSKQEEELGSKTSNQENETESEIRKQEGVMHSTSSENKEEIEMKRDKQEEETECTEMKLEEETESKASILENEMSSTNSKQEEEIDSNTSKQEEEVQLDSNKPEIELHTESTQQLTDDEVNTGSIEEKEIQVTMCTQEEEVNTSKQDQAFEEIKIIVETEINAGNVQDENIIIHCRQKHENEEMCNTQEENIQNVCSNREEEIEIFDKKEEEIQLDSRDLVEGLELNRHDQEKEIDKQGVEIQFSDDTQEKENNRQEKNSSKQEVELQEKSSKEGDEEQATNNNEEDKCVLEQQEVPEEEPQQRDVEQTHENTNEKEEQQSLETHLATAVAEENEAQQQTDLNKELPSCDSQKELDRGIEEEPSEEMEKKETSEEMEEKETSEEMEEKETSEEMEEKETSEEMEEKETSEDVEKKETSEETDKGATSDTTKNSENSEQASREAITGKEDRKDGEGNDNNHSSEEASPTNVSSCVDITQGTQMENSGTVESPQAGPPEECPEQTGKIAESEVKTTVDPEAQSNHNPEPLQSADTDTGEKIIIVSPPSATQTNPMTRTSSTNSHAPLRLRRSSSSRASYPTILSEDTFRDPHNTDKHQHTEPQVQTQATNTVSVTSVNPEVPVADAAWANPDREKDGLKSKTRSLPAPAVRTDKPKRRGLFHRFRAEAASKSPVPKILIQDFSEGEEKLTSKERRRRRRERERREKEEEKERKKREKEVEKEKEKERKKPQTRGKSFQVLNKKSDESDVPAKTIPAKRHSVPHSESYF